MEGEGEVWKDEGDVWKGEVCGRMRVMYRGVG